MRNEKENVDGLNLPDPNILDISYILEDGKVLTQENFTAYAEQLKKQNKKPAAICAKVSYNKNTKLSSYYILCAGSLMFDPTEIDTRYKTRNTWKFRRATKSTFQTYHNFLKTKHKIFLRQAERNI